MATSERRRPKRKRSFGNRLKTAAIIGIVSGAGAVIVLFAVAWAATEIGLGTVEHVADVAEQPGDHSAFAAATDLLGNFPWMVGGAVALITFLRELADL